VWHGDQLGLIDDLSIATVTHHSDATGIPAKLRGSELGVEERNVARASYLVEPLVQWPAGSPPLSSLKLQRAVCWTEYLWSVQFRDRSAQGAGVTAQASLRRSVTPITEGRGFHPDGGGEEWAFRILVQAYEMLSSCASPARPASKRRRLRRTRLVPSRNEAPVGPSRNHDSGVEPFRRRCRALCVRYPGTTPSTFGSARQMKTVS
jgi:hypothetical protein